MSRQSLSEFELLVLLAILRLEEDAYGVPIAREIEDTTGRSVARAVVYAALDRLEERGLVRSRMGAPTPERGGRAKRYFRVSANGLRAAREAQRALIALWRGVPEFDLKRG